MRRAALAWVIAVLGCGSEPAAATPAPAATDPWRVAALGVVPIVLAPSLATPCGDAVVVVGTDSLYALDRGTAQPLGGESDASLESALTEHYAHAWTLEMISGAYNGPGGEPLFRWRVEQHQHPTLLVDRRVPATRLAAVLRVLAPLAYGIRLAGVDADGAPTCVLTLTEQALEGAEPAAAYDASVETDGTLRVHRGEDTFTPDGTTAAWPGQDDGQRIPVRVRRAAGLGAEGVLRAAAAVPSFARWPVLVPGG